MMQAFGASWLPQGAPGHGGGFLRHVFVSEFAASAPPGPVIVRAPMGGSPQPSLSWRPSWPWPKLER